MRSMIKPCQFYNVRARRVAAGDATYGFDDANKTGSANVTSDEGNPSTIDYVNSNDAAYYHLGVSGGISGDFDLTWTIPTAQDDYRAWNIGVFRADETGSFNSSSGNGGMSSMTDSWWVNHNALGSPGVYKGGTNEQSLTIAADDVFRINRTGSTVTVYQDEVQRHQWTSQDSGDFYVCFAHDNGGAEPDADITGAQITN